MLGERLDHADINEVLVIGRTPIEMQHPKLQELIHDDFINFSEVKTQLKGYDACFFCLGVSASGMTMEQYQHITHDFTLSLAKILHESNQFMTFNYVSGEGTDSTEKGRIMWARVKGKTVTKGNSTYYCVQNMSGTWDCYDSDGKPPPGNSLHDNEIEAGMDVYLLAYVDTASGGYTWYPQRVLFVKDQAASPITGSCLTSMNPDVNIG